MTLVLRQHYLFVQPMIDRRSVWVTCMETYKGHYFWTAQYILNRLPFKMTKMIYESWQSIHNCKQRSINVLNMWFTTNKLVSANHQVKSVLYSQDLKESTCPCMRTWEEWGLILWDVTTDNRMRYWIKVRSLGQTADSLQFQLRRIPAKGGGVLESVCINRWQTLYGSQLWKKV